MMFRKPKGGVFVLFVLAGVTRLLVPTISSRSLLLIVPIV